MTKRKSVLRISSKGFIRAYICVNVWEGCFVGKGILCLQQTHNLFSEKFFQAIKVNLCWRVHF
jgi:hypothetical protein